MHYFGIAAGIHKGKWSKCKLEPCTSENHCPNCGMAPHILTVCKKEPK